MRIGLPAFVIAALTVWAAPAAAQDAADAGMKAWQGAPCLTCHGVFAQGGGGGEQPAGPSLRQTSLDRAAIVETISCGRPGTQMPYFHDGAYTQTACWGLPTGAVPADVVLGGAIAAAQIEQIADYLMARIVGKGAITREECGVYYANPNHARCTTYR